jgi:hypothetical protein
LGLSRKDAALLPVALALILADLIMRKDWSEVYTVVGMVGLKNKDAS